MSDSTTAFIGMSLLALVLAAPALLAQQAPTSLEPYADLVCPGCPPEASVLTMTEVIRLMATTVFERGLSFLVIGATAAVGLPWVVAGIAIAVIYLPRWLKAS